MTGGSSMSVATAIRRPATVRPGGPLAASQRNQAVRMNLFVLVRVLFQYLEMVDRSVLTLAKEVLKDCERKHNTKDSKYQSLADAIGERVRDAVGEAHWAQARKIQRQLALNQQKKKMAAMKAAAKSKRQSSSRMNATAAQSQELNLSNTRSVSVGRERVAPRDEAMEAAKTMSSLSQASCNPPSRSPSMMMDQDADESSSVATVTTGNVAPCRQAGGSLKIDSDEASSLERVGSPSLLPFRKRVMFAP